MSDCPQITYRKHSFLSSLALGSSALAITLVISCTVVIIYSIHFVGDQSEKLVLSVANVIRGLPELRSSLPPVLADVLDDHRQPDYRDEVEISARTTPVTDRGRMRTVVEVANNGDEVISLLSLRIIVLDAHDEVLAESSEWAATPIAADHDWRGPLLPGSRRHFASYAHRVSPVYSLSDIRTEVEITDIRIWNGPKEASIAENTPSATETSSLQKTD